MWRCYLKALVIVIDGRIEERSTKDPSKNKVSIF